MFVFFENYKKKPYKTKISSIPNTTIDKATFDTMQSYPHILYSVFFFIFFVLLNIVLYIYIYAYSLLFLTIKKKA